MRQDFHDRVAQVAGGDIHNYCINSSPNHKSERQGLVSAQRQELHELCAKCEELGAAPKESWRRVRAQLGVSDIREISAEQFPLVRTAIQMRLEQLQEEADKRRIVGKIIEVMNEKYCCHVVDDFCELNFGRTKLEHLGKLQLLNTLEFVLQYQSATQYPRLLTESRTTSLFDFIHANKKSAAAMFVLGILFGGSWR